MDKMFESERSSIIVGQGGSITVPLSSSFL